jgi:hypothetical protein
MVATGQLVHTIIYLFFSLVLPASGFSEISVDDESILSSKSDFYVSFVMASRVDDLRGDSVGRVQNSVQFLQRLCYQHNVRGEIIIVEWNPFEGQQKLSDALRPAVNSSSPVPIRIITVSRELHATVEAGTGQTFFEFLAKNVGARRARGDFILITNGDVILNDDVLRALSLEMLDADAYFRVPRVELGTAFDPSEPFESR